MKRAIISPGSRWYLPRGEFGKPAVILTHIGGSPIYFQLSEVSCFEKCSLPKTLKNFSLVHLVNGYSYIVLESRDEILDAIEQQCRRGEP